MAVSRCQIRLPSLAGTASMPCGNKLQTRGPWLLPTAKVLFFKSSLQPSHSGGGQASCRGSPKGLPYSYHLSMPEITVTGAPPSPPETHAPATSCLTSGSTWARKEKAGLPIPSSPVLSALLQPGPLFSGGQRIRTEDLGVLGMCSVERYLQCEAVATTSPHTPYKVQK